MADFEKFDAVKKHIQTVFDLTDKIVKDDKQTNCYLFKDLFDTLLGTCNIKNFYIKDFLTFLEQEKDFIICCDEKSKIVAVVGKTSEVNRGMVHEILDWVLNNKQTSNRHKQTKNKKIEKEKAGFMPLENKRFKSSVDLDLDMGGFTTENKPGYMRYADLDSELEGSDEYTGNKMNLFNRQKDAVDPYYEQYQKDRNQTGKKSFTKLCEEIAAAFGTNPVVPIGQL